uniref:40S ribosomal protein S5-like n=1 Tax=Dermatophagoides pteronyssinus TaxID=6956 RepID=A0A6P6XXE3_DERPT|nr:40S ribosomal protein S5-like [Dermatophagoides pteronyssinus]
MSAVEIQKVKLFGKHSYERISCSDLALVDYISVRNAGACFTPHTSTRNRKRFSKANCPIVERLVNSVMMHGRNTGKKLKAIRAVREAFDIIELTTNKNPIQVLVDAVAKGGAREDSTRIGAGGIVRRQAVDVSPYRRVGQSLYHMTQGARVSAFRSGKTLSECLADEIVACSRESSNSYTIKKKDEIERVAKVNR